MVADSIGIQSYLKDKHNVESKYIAYGSEIPEIKNHRDVLVEYRVAEFEYNLLIARMEPENNIEMILEGIVSSGSNRTTIVVGKTENKFGQYLERKFQEKYIKFLGGIYDKPKIDTLRKYAYLYYHGHSVGGTNPSLLEAMAVGALISANDNEFNKSVLNEDVLYFQSIEDVANQQNMILNLDRDKNATNCINKIRTDFNWDKISSEYLRLFEHGLAQRVNS